MEQKGTTQVQVRRRPFQAPARAGLHLQRQCACGQHTIGGGECEECCKKHESLGQRTGVVSLSPSMLPSFTTEPPQTELPESPAADSFPAQSRFAHDFSQVPIYTASPASGHAASDRASAAPFAPSPLSTAGHAPAIQAKYEVTQSTDVYEREADEVAERAAQPEQQPDSAAPVEKAPLPQPSPTGNGILNILKQSPAMPLSSAVRRRVEPLFGVDLSSVRVHTGAAASEAVSILHAKAFTSQDHIWLGARQSPESVELMAHEATHVVQQATSSPPPTLQKKAEDEQSSEDDEDDGVEETGSEENGTEKNERVQQLTLQKLGRSAGPARDISPSASRAAEQELVSPQPRNAEGVSTEQIQENHEQSAKQIANALTMGGGSADHPPPAPPASDRHATLNEHAAVQQHIEAIPGVRAVASRGSPTVLMPEREEEPMPPTPAIPQAEVRPTPAPSLRSGERAREASPAPSSEQAAAPELEARTSGISLPAARTATPGSRETSAGAADGARQATPPTGTTGEAPSALEETALAGALPDQRADLPRAGVSGAAALRAQLPKREPTLEEFITMLESQQTPEQERIEVQGHLGMLQADAEQEKALVLREAEQQKSKLAALVEPQIAVVQTTMRTQSSAIRTHFAAVRSSLRRSAEQRKRSLETQVARDIANIETSTQTRVTEVENQLSQRQRDLTAFAEEQRNQPPVIAREEGERAGRELEVTARECEQIGENEAGHYPGNDDPAPDQREAAREVARQSAADIRAKKPAIAADLQSRADGFSGKYMEYADQTNAQITQAGADTTPALSNMAVDATRTIREGKASALRAIDDRLRADLRRLDAIEAQAIGHIRRAMEELVRQLRTAARQGSQEITTAASLIVGKIDGNVRDAQDTIAGAEEPFLPGVLDIVEATRATIADTGSVGREQLEKGVIAASQMITEVAASFAPQAAAIVTGANKNAGDIQNRFASATNQTLQAYHEQVQNIVREVDTQQSGLITTLLDTVDGTIREAQSKISEITDQFRDQTRQAADQSIEDAKKPRTDPLEDRVHDAAEQAGEAWYVGLFKALGEILVGLVVAVALALLIAGIAAFFGVILTAWTAMMIAGAILLTAGLIMSLVSRYSQLKSIEGGGATTFVKALGLAVIDTVGITGIIEGIRGKELITNRRLSSGERTHREVTGVVSLVMTVLGAKGAIKGLPGGAFTRPVELPNRFSLGMLGRFWKGVPGLEGENIGGVRSLAVELYTGTRENVGDLGKWLRQRLSGRAPTLGEPAPTPGGVRVGALEEPTAARSTQAAATPEQLPTRPPASGEVSIEPTRAETSQGQPAQKILSLGPESPEALPSGTEPAEAVPKVEETTKPQTTKSSPPERYYYGGGEAGSEGMRTLPSSPTPEMAPRPRVPAAEFAKEDGLVDETRGVPEQREAFANDPEFYEGIKGMEDVPGANRVEGSAGEVDGHPAVPEDRPEGGLFDKTAREIDEANAARERGNTFNTEREGAYPHNEVEIESPYEEGKRYRLDSYDPGRAIVSRKYPAGEILDVERGTKYVSELADKYPPGARIANTPKNVRAGIAGQVLRGQPILEVPVLLDEVPPEVLELAKRVGVVIRDAEGTIYR